MDTKQVVNPFSQHYLEIAALDPVANQPPPVAATNPGMVIAFPLIAFFSLFILFFTVVFFKRMHQLRSVFMIFIFALVMGAVPIALQTVGQTTRVETKADPDSIPRTLVVTSVTPTGFVISWNTNKSTTGAISLKSTAVGSAADRTYEDTTNGTYHRLVVLNLKPGQTYQLKVLSDARWFDHGGQPITITLPEK